MGKKRARRVISNLLRVQAAVEGYGGLIAFHAHLLSQLRETLRWRTTDVAGKFLWVVVSHGHAVGSCLAFCTVHRTLTWSNPRVRSSIHQINILNSAYSTTRFAFTYAWWSAYGFSRHVKDNAAEAAEMELINQEKVCYSGVGSA